MSAPAAAAGPAEPSAPAGAITPTVLFVDDEEDVLAGLRGSLRRLRRSYRFLFAVGAQEALATMAGEPVDVVVTDMRMPGMTGVDLLERVREQHPEVVRYVLSGEAGKDLVVRSIPVAHRWLTKPCDPQLLTGALADAVRHRALASDEAIRRAIGEVSALPTAPALYRELLALLADGEVEIDRVVALVGRDPAISAKLLQWANSAFSAGNPVGDLHGAVTRVGLSALTQLVLSAEIFRTFLDVEAIPGCTPAQLQRYVESVSGLAARLAPHDEATTAGLGGLLSHVGLLLEIGHLPHRLAEAYELANRTGCGLIDAERQLFGVGHPDLAGHLLSVWGLPSDLVLMVAGSHQPPPVEPGVPLDATGAVRAARLVAQREPWFSELGDPHRDRLDDPLDQAVTRWADQLGSTVGGAPCP